MVVDEGQLAHHLRVIDKLYTSRACLALVAGMLYGQLHHIRHTLASLRSDALSDAEKQRLIDAIDENLKDINPILEREFYPTPPAQAKGPEEPKAKSPEQAAEAEERKSRS